jgi:hypothetical protein
MQLHGAYVSSEKHIILRGGLWRHAKVSRHGVAHGTRKPGAAARQPDRIRFVGSVSRLVNVAAGLGSVDRAGVMKAATDALAALRQPGPRGGRSTTKTKIEWAFALRWPLIRR